MANPFWAYAPPGWKERERIRRLKAMFAPGDGGGGFPEEPPIEPEYPETDYVPEPIEPEPFTPFGVQQFRRGEAFTPPGLPSPFRMPTPQEASTPSSVAKGIGDIGSAIREGIGAARTDIKEKGFLGALSAAVPQTPEETMRFIFGPESDPAWMKAARGGPGFMEIGGVQLGGAGKVPRVPKGKVPKPAAAEIAIGDNIRLSIHGAGVPLEKEMGTVISEVEYGGRLKIPGWRVKTPTGEDTIIPKDMAVLLKKGEPVVKTAEAVKPPTVAPQPVVAAPAAAKAPGVAKKPWQMTDLEFALSAKTQLGTKWADRLHALQAKRVEAVERGKLSEVARIDVNIDRLHAGLPPLISTRQVKMIPSEVPKPPVTPAVAKEPWQMTREQYIASDSATRRFRNQVETLTGEARDRASKQWDRAFGGAERVHRQTVIDASRAGKPVPPEVLADYPDLARGVAPGAESVTAKGSIEPAVPVSPAEAPQVAPAEAARPLAEAAPPVTPGPKHFGQQEFPTLDKAALEQTGKDMGVPDWWVSPKGEAFKPSKETALVPAGPTGISRLPPRGPTGITPQGPTIPPGGYAPLNEAQEKLWKVLTDIGIDKDLALFSIQESAAVAAAKAKTVFTYLRGVVDPAVMRDPRVQSSFLSAARYQAAYDSQRAGALTLFQNVGEEVWGKGWRKGTPFTKKFVGSSAVARGRGTLLGSVYDVIHNPGDYKLTPAQRGFIDRWDQFLNKDRTLSVAMGVDMGGVEGSYITHMFRQPRRLGIFTAPRRTMPIGKEAVTKERLLRSTQEQASAAAQMGLEVETDPLVLMNARLSMLQRARSTQIMMKGLVKQLNAEGIQAFELKGRGSLPYGYQPVMIEGKGWVLPSEIADDVMAAITPLKEGPSEKLLTRGIQLWRGVKLNLDIGALGRQGAYSMARAPKAYLRSVGSSVKVLASRDGWLKYLGDNLPDMEYWAQRGSQWSVSPIDLASGLRNYISKQPLDRVPIIGWLNNAQFSVFLPMLKLNMNKALLAQVQAIKEARTLGDKLPWLNKLFKGQHEKIAQMTLGEQEKAVADVINNAIGGVEWAKIGKSKPGLLSQITLFTEGWTRAKIGLYINAAKAKGIEGILARRLILQQLAVAALAGEGLNFAFGRETDYGPNSNSFLDINSPWGRVSLIPAKAEFRALMRIVLGKTEDDYAQGALVDRLLAIPEYAEGRLGMPLRTITEVAAGVKYTGEKISNKALYALEQIQPIMTGQAIEEWGRGYDPEGIAIRRALEGIGFSARPYSMTQRLNEEAKRKYGMSWLQLKQKEPAKAGALEQTEEARAIRRQTSRGTEAQIIREGKYRRFDALVERSKNLGTWTGTGWSNSQEPDPANPGKTRPYLVKQWKDDLAKDYAAIATEWATRERILGPRRDKVPEAGTKERARWDYYKIADKYTEKDKDGKPIPGGKILDMEGFIQEQDEFLAGLPPEMEKDVLDNLGINDDALAQEFRRDKRVIKEAYWGPDKAFREELSKRAKIDFEFFMNKAKEEESRGNTIGAQQIRFQYGLKGYEDALMNNRRMLRLKNPQVDELVVKWGYQKNFGHPLNKARRLQQSATRVRELAGAGAR